MFLLLLLGGGLAVAAVAKRSVASKAPGAVATPTEPGGIVGTGVNLSRAGASSPVAVANQTIKIGPARARVKPAGTVTRKHDASESARAQASVNRLRSGVGRAAKAPTGTGRRDRRTGAKAPGAGAGGPTTPGAGGGGVNYGKTAAQAGAAAAASAVGAPWAAPIAAWGAGKGYDEVSSWF